MSGLLRQKPMLHGHNQSSSPTPLKRVAEELNSDIMVLISKPQNQKSRQTLDPLRVAKSLTNSTDSRETSESKLNGFKDRKSFMYPPDLKTA